MGRRGTARDSAVGTSLCKLLLDEGLITHETVEQMRTWQHSGFSVDKSVLIKAEDRDALERLVQYIARCPFSLDRILKITPTGHVVSMRLSGDSAVSRSAELLVDGRRDDTSRGI